MISEHIRRVAELTGTVVFPVNHRCTRRRAGAPSARPSVVDISGFRGTELGKTPGLGAADGRYVAWARVRPGAAPADDGRFAAAEPDRDQPGTGRLPAQRPA